MSKKDSSSTLFVRNLTKDTTKEELSSLFADIGPVKHAIVIHERHGGPSKGFGFVTFALPADAIEACKRNFTLKGKSLKLEFASETSGKAQKQKEEKQPVEASLVEEEEETKQVETTTSTPPNVIIDWKKRKDEKRKQDKLEEEERKRTIVLFGLPDDFSEQQLRKRLKKRAGGAKIVSAKKVNEEYHILFDTANSISTAVKEISGRSWGGSSTIFARRYHQVAHTPALKMKCRLICRNLGFHINETILMDTFKSYGPIEQVVIKRDAENRSKGFGFIQFYCRHDAQQAVDAVNGSLELGPKGGKAGGVAVDFALTKELYEKIKARGDETASKEVEKKSEVIDETSTKEENDEEEESENEDKESDDQEVEEESDDEEEKKEGDDIENDEEDDSDSDDDELHESESKSEDSTPIVASKNADKGVQEGRSVYVRNLLFETVEETIRTAFSEFGPVRGVKLIKEPGPNGRSRGMGFVEFWDKASCDKCVDSPDVIVEGRSLLVKRAVDKESAGKLKKVEEEDENGEKKLKKPKKDLSKDKRHLYLANEGRVQIDLVPTADKKKRQALEEEKRTKLKNPMFFLSPTRLSVKNLNRKPDETLDAKGLKKLFKEAAIEGLREKIVKPDEGDRNLFPTKNVAVKVLKAIVFHEDVEDVASRTTGFAFVEMAHHNHALAALRILNNNPKYSYAAAGGKASMKLSEDKRPRLIVSFAIENAAKVRQQKLRTEKSKQLKPQEEEESSKKRPAENKDEEVKKEKRQKKSEQDEAPRQPKLTKNKKKLNEHKVEQEEEQHAVKKSKSSQKKMKKDISNRAFEKMVTKNKKTAADDLDTILTKRKASNLFEVPETKKKRWFDEVDE